MKRGDGVDQLRHQRVKAVAAPLRRKGLRVPANYRPGQAAMPQAARFIRIYVRRCL